MITMNDSGLCYWAIFDVDNIIHIADVLYDLIDQDGIQDIDIKLIECPTFELYEAPDDLIDMIVKQVQDHEGIQ